jgi:heme/copper-type cytochrome/quinol oxidase subunit 4
MKSAVKDKEYLKQTYSFLALRKAVGWIGILLPVVLSLGSVILFGEGSLRKNISLYYYSGMRDVLVGALCSIALFLFFYKGYDRWDNIAADLAALFALGIAFFPTVPEGKYNAAATIHFISAAAFFIILAVMSFFLFTRSKPDPTKRKLIRNKIYLGCGLVMIVCLVAILIFYIFFSEKRPDSRLVFWGETIALIAFGISWLTKGGTLYPDKKLSK